MASTCRHTLPLLALLRSNKAHPQPRNNISRDNEVIHCRTAFLNKCTQSDFMTLGLSLIKQVRRFIFFVSFLFHLFLNLLIKSTIYFYS